MGTAQSVWVQSLQQSGFSTSTGRRKGSICHHSVTTHGIIDLHSQEFRRGYKVGETSGRAWSIIVVERHDWTAATDEASERTPTVLTAAMADHYIEEAGNLQYLPYLQVSLEGHDSSRMAGALGTKGPNGTNPQRGWKS